MAVMVEMVIKVPRDRSKAMKTMEPMVSIAATVALVHKHHSKITVTLVLKALSKAMEVVVAVLIMVATEVTEAMASTVAQTHNRHSRVTVAPTPKEYSPTVAAMVALLAMATMVAQTLNRHSRTMEVKTH